MITNGLMYATYLDKIIENSLCGSRLNRARKMSKYRTSTEQTLILNVLFSMPCSLYYHNHFPKKYSKEPLEVEVELAHFFSYSFSFSDNVSCYEMRKLVMTIMTIVFH